MKNTLLGVLLSALVIVVIGGFLAGFESSKPTPTSTPTPRAVSVTPATPAAKPVAVAHPAEGELNELGLTLNGGIAVRVGGKAGTEQGGGVK